MGSQHHHKWATSYTTSFPYSVAFPRTGVPALQEEPSILRRNSMRQGHSASPFLYPPGTLLTFPALGPGTRASTHFLQGSWRKRLLPPVQKIAAPSALLPEPLGSLLLASSLQLKTMGHPSLKPGRVACWCYHRAQLVPRPGSQRVLDASTIYPQEQPLWSERLKQP